MTKYRFSYSERYALFKTYDGKCFQCEEPLQFREMVVDHIVPEWLVEQPDRLRQLRQVYRIDEAFPDFQINDFCNWVPMHPKCNRRKGNHIPSKVTTLFFLETIYARLDAVRQEYTSVRRERSMGRLFGSLSTAIENQQLTFQDVREFVDSIEVSQHSDEPLVLSFGLMIDDVLDSALLPEDVSRDYPYLCDWLELDLVKHLRSIIRSSFHYTQPSERWGDGLSVRMVFPGLNDAELDNFDLPWWRILEANDFWHIFGERYSDAFPTLPEREYFGQLERD